MADERWIFGYGSLVNAATHELEPIYPARLSGWCRDWRKHGAPGKVSLSVLTIEREAATHIDGLIARVRPDQWAALCERESGYDLVALNRDELTHEGPDGLTIHTFQSRSTAQGGPDGPIMQSYLDCVLQGFEKVFDEAALSRFFASTRSWDVPVRRDRNAPVYPRAVHLSASQSQQYDELARKNGIRFLDGLDYET